MGRLITDLTARVVLITLITSVVSYIVVELGRTSVPPLFVAFGTVIMANVLFDLWRYNVASAMPVKAKTGFLDRARLITDLTMRVVIITAIYAVISYFVIRRAAPFFSSTTPGQLAIDIPVLLVMFGIVIMISNLFDLWRYDVMDAVPTKK
jgi:hypothetical protein